ncbi:unnamed protein product, partial [Trichobilharzia regenti]
FFFLGVYAHTTTYIKQLLEAETCRAEAAETRQKLEQREFNEYRAREEAEVTGLKASLSARRAEIKQLKDYLSEVMSSLAQNEFF